MEHRSALIVDDVLTTADGYAEWATAEEGSPDCPRPSAAVPSLATRACDTRALVAAVRAIGFAPHIARNTSR
jgi:hypothetical protein